MNLFMKRATSLESLLSLICYPVFKCVVGIVVSRVIFDELYLVWRVAVDLICREQVKGGLRAGPPCSLKEIQRAPGVEVDVVKGPGCREVVARLRGRVDDCVG